MIATLLQQHDHLVRTLDLLEVQFLDLCRDREPDYRVMLSIVTYIQEFPERVHHPAEDAILSILIERGGEDEALARKLVSDHTELELITRRLRDRIEDVIASGLADAGALQAELSTFLSRQRGHLHVEERLVYPRLQQVMTADDWRRVGTMVPELGQRPRSGRAAGRVLTRSGGFRPKKRPARAVFTRGGDPLRPPASRAAG